MSSESRDINIYTFLRDLGLNRRDLLSGSSVIKPVFSERFDSSQSSLKCFLNTSCFYCLYYAHPEVAFV